MAKQEALIANESSASASDLGTSSEREAAYARLHAPAAGLCVTALCPLTFVACGGDMHAVTDGCRGERGAELHCEERDDSCDLYINC